MLQKISINPRQIKNYTELKIETPGPLSGFPFVAIDEDSYIVDAEVLTGIDFDPAGGRHCISIGKECAISTGITFMIDPNHDYASVAQGEVPFLDGVKRDCRVHRKGTILIENDVWIGLGATIMAGVRLHNGCVIATNSVVTKDVPPYAIVGGNPAKIIRYRFDDAIVEGLQKISWWDWSKETKLARKEDFSLPPAEFVEKYLPEAEEQIRKYELQETIANERKLVLVFPDLLEKFPLYPRIISQFCEEERTDMELLIVLSKQESTKENITLIENILQKYEDKECYINIQSGEDWIEEALFQLADYYVTTRDRQMVHRACLCERYGTKVLYGTDNPIFK